MDELLKIAEEMGDWLEVIDEDGAVRYDKVEAWADRIRAFWTPERRAFYEAAEKLAVNVIEAMRHHNLDSMNLDVVEAGDLVLTYGVLSLASRDPAHGNPHAGEAR